MAVLAHTVVAEAEMLTEAVKLLLKVIPTLLEVAGLPDIQLVPVPPAVIITLT
jgi:hypothetical protein